MTIFKKQIKTKNVKYFLIKQKVIIFVHDLNKLRSQATKSEFSDVFASMNRILMETVQLKELESTLQLLQARHHRNTEHEIKKLRTNQETDVENNILISDILNFIADIESKIPPNLPKVSVANISEPYLQNFENYLKMNNYKPELDKGSPIRSYFYLREMYDIIEPIVLSLNSYPLKSTIQRGNFISTLSIFNEKLSIWINTIEGSECENTSLIEHLKKVKSLYSDFKKECLKTSSDMVFNSKKATFFRALNSLKIELEKWIGQAEKYRLN